MIRKIFFAIQFLVFYFFQLLRSNIYLAGLTLSPKLNMEYGFIQVPLKLKSDFGLLLFSNLVSMTPGSLVTDINRSDKMATVHVIITSSEKKVFEEVNSMQEKIKNFTE